jgi:hypothetical protein
VYQAVSQSKSCGCINLRSRRSPAPLPHGLCFLVRWFSAFALITEDSTHYLLLDSSP